MRVQRMEVSDDVLAAIIAVVEYWRSSDPDDIDLVFNHLPVVEAWLVELGLWSPAAQAIKD
jgi:hypothetical protein